EYAIGVLRTLGVRWSAAEVVEFLGRMDQRLLLPPNVKGWDGEQKWINSSTWAARVDYARAVSLLESEDDFGPDLDLERILPADVKDPLKIVDALDELLLQGELPPEVHSDLAEFLVTTTEGEGEGAPKGVERNPERFRDDDEFRNTKIRAALGLILAL